MFEEILRDVVEQTDGALASVLMGFDGIPVETYNGDGVSLNVETVGAEYSAVLGQVRQAAEMLELGHAHEVAVQAENMTTIIRLLNEEYFVAVAVAPHGNFGKARYVLRITAPKLLENLT
jgi:predicted regulator of Ras-like GTPase activity (Roadblock/LC7/MglB family)